MITFFLSQAGKELYKTLQYPNEWEIFEHRSRHLPSGISMWCSSGSWFFDGDELDGTPHFLGLIERHFLWLKMKKVRNTILLSRADANKKVALIFKESSSRKEN